MRHAQRTPLGWIGVAVLTLGLFLSGCSGTSTTRAGRPDGTKAPTPSPTAAATGTKSPDSVELAGCPPVPVTPPQPQSVAVGALQVSIPERMPNHDYPSALVPNNQPNAPYQVPLTAVEAQQAGAFHPNPPVNPTLSTGYVLEVCNQTSAPHTVTGLSVSIASFTPSSGPVSVWHLCAGGAYDAATKQTTTGCGGATGPGDYLTATLPTDSTGAEAPAIANPQSQRGGPNLPLAINPNASIQLLVALDGLTSQGTYALSFNIAVDGAAPTTLIPSDGPFLIAPSAIVWTGTACQTPTMQAQIPPASQDTYYVCPPAA